MPRGAPICSMADPLQQRKYVNHKEGYMNTNGISTAAPSVTTNEYNATGGNPEGILNAASPKMPAVTSNTSPFDQEPKGRPANDPPTTSGVYCCTPGPQGPQGEKGDRGATGATGEKGDRGATGATGEKGDRGATGATGEKGDRGATGATGEKGDRGATGATGEKGDRGATGATGEKGAQGKAGATGERGARGPKGESGGLGLIEKKKLWAGDFMAGFAAKAPIKLGHHADKENKLSVKKWLHQGADYLKDKLHSSKGRSDVELSESDIDEVEKEVEDVLVGEDDAVESTAPASQESRQGIDQHSAQHQDAVIPAPDSTTDGISSTGSSVSNGANKHPSQVIILNNHF
jgi:hypothetical protein